MYFIYHIPGVKIGCSINPERRVRAQKFREFEILEEHEDEGVACIRERELQKKYGYAIDTISYKQTVSMKEWHTEEVIRKRGASISKAQKGRIHLEETKQKISKATKGKRAGRLNPKYATGPRYIELNTSFIGYLSEIVDRFTLSQGAYIYSSVRTGKPISRGKYRGLQFKIYEE